MEYLRICGAVALCSAAILLFVGREKELVKLISSLLYMAVTLCVLTRAKELITQAHSYLHATNFSFDFAILLKAGGIAWIGTVASTICENTGQASAARAIDLLSVLEILYISMPILRELLDKISIIFLKS